MILYINACVRKESRTKKIADHLLSLPEGNVKGVRLHDLDMPKIDEAFLQWRDLAIAKGTFTDEVFALAQQIVIAAPFWDHSFPASLKRYFVHVDVLGITFAYHGEEYGFGYVDAYAKTVYGIPEAIMAKAQGIDLAGADVEKIMREAFAGCEQAV